MRDGRRKGAGSRGGGSPGGLRRLLRERLDSRSTDIPPLADPTVGQESRPYIPSDAIFARIGDVNSAPFYGADVGNVMYQGCRSESQYSISELFGTDKLMSRRLTNSRSGRSRRGNMYLKPDGSGLDVLLDAGGGPIYPSSDLSELFF